MIMPSVARVKFIKTKVILGIIPRLSQTKFHHIRITKSKVIHEKKRKKMENLIWITKRGNEGITNRR